MTRALLLAAVVVVVVVVVAERPSEACSVEPTYMAPTNVELVASSSGIVLATATRSVGAQVEMEVLRVIRGRGLMKPGDRLAVDGSPTRYSVGSQRHDFSKARRGVRGRGCTALDYALGKSYVLMLEEGQGVLFTREVPFARVNEQVDGKDDPWVVAVTEYARIADIAKAADRRRALEALIARGTHTRATATERAIADDVKSHFETPTPAKSFLELATMEQAGVAPHVGVLMAIATGRDPAARAYMRKVVVELRASQDSPEPFTIDAVGAYYAAVTDPVAIGQLAAYYVSLGKRTTIDRWPLMWLLLRRADATNLKTMEQALLGADDDDAGQLAGWFVRFPSPVAEKELLQRIGGTFGGGGHHRWNITLALAGMGNRAVIAWATKMLASTATAAPEDRWLALHAIARSPLPEADALVPAIIAGAGEDLVNLIQGYEAAHHANADRRLAEIAKLPNLDPKAQTWTKRAIEGRAKRP